MAWVKLDDHFAEHPKIATAGPLAGWLHVCALCYCNRHLTDGFIPARVVGTLADFAGINDEASGEANPKQLASILLDVGLWEEDEGGYRIHDYLEYNPSREEVIATREKRAEAGRIGGKRSGMARNEAKPKQNASNVPSKNEAKSNPVPVPVPVVLSEQPPCVVPPEGNDPHKNDPKEPVKRKTRVPDPYPLTEYHYTFGADRGFTAEEVETETQLFVNHWQSKGELRENWDASFRTWIMKAMKYREQDAQKVRPFRGRQSPVDVNAELDRRWDQEMGLSATGTDGGDVIEAKGYAR
jgi:hypothetical protein